MAAVLDRLHIDVAQITDLLVVAEIANVGQVAASVDDIDVAVLADQLLKLSHIFRRA
jgi:hypothetical protein